MPPSLLVQDSVSAATAIQREGELLLSLNRLSHATGATTLTRPTECSLLKGTDRCRPRLLKAYGTAALCQAARKSHR